MPAELLADVAVRAAIPGANPVFTYRVPARLHALVRPGQLVWAPLRRQRVQGIILDLYRQQDGGSWVLEGDAANADLRPSPLDRMRLDPDAPTAPDAPVLRDLCRTASQSLRRSIWRKRRCSNFRPHRLCRKRARLPAPAK